METYVVGFNIFDARGLVIPEGGPCDPFVVVECCGKEYQSETKIGKQAIVTYNESYIWSDIQLYPEQFSAASITFSIYARNWFARNTLIGRATLQLSNVNARRNHVYAKKWLTVTRENDPEPTGAICLTVFSLRPGDSAPSVDQQEGNDGGGEGEEEADAGNYEDLTKAVLGGVVEVPGKPHHMLVTIHRVEDLASGSNPFVSCEFNGSLVSTSQAKNVEQHTFNETILIPVVAPLYEDVIVVKLWNGFIFSTDELLAQGMLSFSELRNRPMLPRWFNFYGYNPEEISDADVKIVSEAGEAVEPNFYQGKMLVSARIDKLEDLDELQPAGIIAATRFEEPASAKINLLIDVYMVAGAVGRECQVEVTLASQSVQSEFVYPAIGGHQHNDISNNKSSSMLSSSMLSSSSKNQQSYEAPTIFHFNQKQGRPPPISMLMAEDVTSQPDCLINVYTRGVMSGRVRIGYARVALSDIVSYEPGNPAVPQFFPLKPMPWNGTQKLPASLLMTLERTQDEAVCNQRHNRKLVKNMQYILRAYVFAAKNINLEKTSGDPELSVRVACAGASVESTRIVRDLRPTWMTCLELTIALMSDHPKKPPTMEPITVSLLQAGTDLGKAVCRYTFMRQRDALEEWEPYSLEPQWVNVLGGSYNSKTTGAICVAFELLRKKDAPELPPSRMWPKDELLYQPSIDFCRLKRATLHVSLLGLRDMAPISSLGGLLSYAPQNPVVEFKVRMLLSPEDVWKMQKANNGSSFALEDESSMPSSISKPGSREESSDSRFWSCTFRYMTLKPGGESTNPADRNKRWESGGGTNFEFFQYRRMNIMLPELPVFAPWVTVKVGEASSAYNPNQISTSSSSSHNNNSSAPFSSFFSSSSSNNNSSQKSSSNVTPIADCRMALGPKLPWLKDIAEYHDILPKETFIEESAEERAAGIRELRRQQLKDENIEVIKPPEQTEED